MVPRVRVRKLTYVYVRARTRTYAHVSVRTCAYTECIVKRSVSCRNVTARYVTRRAPQQHVCTHVAATSTPVMLRQHTFIHGNIYVYMVPHVRARTCTYVRVRYTCLHVKMLLQHRWSIFSPFLEYIINLGSSYSTGGHSAASWRNLRGLAGERCGIIPWVIPRHSPSMGN